MDKVYKSAETFKRMLSVKYTFVVSHKRKLKTIVLDFQSEDFRHAVGLHYIDDIVIERNPSKVIDAIINKKITDKILYKSNKYNANLPYCGNVKERIEEMCFIEEYLDKSDFIRIYEWQAFGSNIEADFFIEASNMKRKSTVYIFIRKRVENDNYVVVSFFKKHNVFRGTSLYWMLKEKDVNGVVTELYKNSSYRKELE